MGSPVGGLIVFCICYVISKYEEGVRLRYEYNPQEETEL